MSVCNFDKTYGFQGIGMGLKLGILLEIAPYFLYE